MKAVGSNVEGGDGVLPVESCTGRSQLAGGGAQLP